MQRSTLLFSSAMLLAGTIGVFVIESGVSALNAVFLRSLIASVALGIFCTYKGIFKRDNLYMPELRYIILGGVILVGNWVFFFQSLTLSSITIAVVSYYTAPFFIILLGSILLKSRISHSAIIWTIVAFAGLILITTTGKASISANPSLVSGVGFGIAAAIFYAVITMIGKKIDKTPWTLVVFIQMVIGTILLSPFANLAEVMNGQTNWMAILILGVVHTAFLYLIFYKSVHEVPVGLLASLAFIDPLIAILSDIMVYSTPLSILQVTGIGLILVSAFFVSRSQTTEATRAKDNYMLLSQPRVHSHLIG